MRLYLGSLARGSGIELGAGDRPLPVSLEADIRYVEAFDLASERSRSFPNAAGFNDFVSADLYATFESMPFAADSLDFIIASHVIEHSPNPIGALVNAHRCLRSGGRLLLIVPDHDRTFDAPREITPIDHLLNDFANYARELDLPHYREWYKKVMRADDYDIKAQADWELKADLHYHCFTPGSFLEMIAAIQMHAPWRICEAFLPRALPDGMPPSIEFYVVLQK